MEDDAKREKSYEESIASDLFNMLQAAKGQGLDLNTGFQNEPMSTRKFALRYMFYGKRELAGLQGMPGALKKRLRRANVLAGILVGGRPVGMHLICAMQMPFAEVESEAQILAAIDTKALQAYADQVRKVLADDFEQAVADSEPESDATH